VRIAVVGPSYPLRGGIAHYTALLSSSLGSRHSVRVVSFSRQYPRLLFPGSKQTDDSEIRIAAEGAEPLIDSVNPVSWARAARSIRGYRPDLVIIQWWHPFFAPAFGFIAGRLRRSSKVMFLCHNVAPHERNRLATLLTRFALRKGHCFIVHSDQDLADLKALVPNAVVRKARHPTYAVFGERPIPKDLARQELGLGQDENVMLFFGLVRPYKGLAYLIQALPTVLASIDATLVIAGEFYEEREKYVRLIKTLGVEGKVRLRDRYIPNEQVGTYFSAADVVVLPYVSATQSGIAQIAYGFERPVITTNVGGLPETVVDGRTGYIVPPANPGALADAIVRFFRNGSPTEFARNIAALREEFSWDRMVETIESLLPLGRSP